LCIYVVHLFILFKKKTHTHTHTHTIVFRVGYLAKAVPALILITNKTSTYSIHMKQEMNHSLKHAWQAFIKV